jgi:hypothetical protein
MCCDTTRSASTSNRANNCGAGSGRAAGWTIGGNSQLVLEAINIFSQLRGNYLTAADSLAENVGWRGWLFPVSVMVCLSRGS